MLNSLGRGDHTDGCSTCEPHACIIGQAEKLRALLPFTSPPAVSQLSSPFWRIPLFIPFSVPELNEHLQLHTKPLTAPLVIQKVLFYSLALFWAAEFVLSQPQRPSLVWFYSARAPATVAILRDRTCN